jgi:hypothetical protein
LHPEMPVPMRIDARTRASLLRVEMYKVAGSPAGKPGRDSVSCARALRLRWEIVCGDHLPLRNIAARMNHRPLLLLIPLLGFLAPAVAAAVPTAEIKAVLQTR